MCGPHSIHTPLASDNKQDGIPKIVQLKENRSMWPNNV